MHRTQAHAHRRIRVGFTLLEVLIVIAIIAALIGLILPMVSRGRERVRMLACINNERQIYAACLAFAIDHDDQLPRPSRIGDGPNNPQVLRTCIWPMDGAGVVNFKSGDFWTYVSPDINARQELVVCPSDNSERLHYGTYQTTVRNFSYSLHAKMINDLDVTHYGSIALRRVTTPARVVMIWEEAAPNDAYCLDLYTAKRWDDQPSARHGSDTVNVDTSTHSAELNAQRTGLGNHCFFDGHVETFSPKYLFENPTLYTGFALK